MTETVFRNGRIVLPDDVIRADVVVRGGAIAVVDDPGPGHAGVDLDGDWLIPGLVELHTDHLEGHYAPRPRVRWNPVAAVQAHDAQIATSGITTVFDALRVGMDDDTKLEPSDMRTLAAAIEDSQRQGRLRAEHFIHLRCEVSAPDVLEGFAAFENDTRVRIASLMDHTPGQRQFTSLDAFRVYYQGKSGMSDADLEALIVKRQAQAEKASGINRAGDCRDRPGARHRAREPRRRHRGSRRRSGRAWRDARRVPDHAARPLPPRMPPASRC